VLQIVVKRSKNHIKLGERLLTDQGLRCASDTMEALNNKISALLTDAAKRCKENGRSTLRPCDL
jgi:hypothetical protein